MQLRRTVRSSKVKLNVKFTHSLKYKMKIYPASPNRGSSTHTSTTPSVASSTLMAMQRVCWPSPRRQPSVTVSRYITGTSGASSRIYRPASSEW